MTKQFKTTSRPASVRFIAVAALLPLALSSCGGLSESDMETIEIPPLAAATGESAPTAKPVAATTLTPIPVEKPAPVMPYPKEGATTYVVESGDSLSVIAAKHGASMADVMKVNGISNANKIRSGQTLYLPAKQAETADATAPEAISVEAAPATTGTDASVLNLPSITSGE